MVDLLLALAHHFLVFGLAGLLAAEVATVREGMTAAQLRRLALLDNLYGVFAVLILIVGFGRVWFGLRGPEFFLGNIWFWLKIAAFAAVGALSAPPTIRFIVWRRKASAEGWLPGAADVASVRRFFVAEIVVFALIPLLAAAMVRVPPL